MPVQPRSMGQIEVEPGALDGVEAAELTVATGLALDEVPSETVNLIPAEQRRGAARGRRRPAPASAATSCSARWARQSCACSRSC